MHNLNTGNYETTRTHLKSVLIAAAIFCAMSALIPASLAIFKLACMLITVILFDSVGSNLRKLIDPFSAQD